MDSLFPSEEITIMRAEKAWVGLRPQREDEGVWIARSMIGPPGYYQEFRAFLESLRESGVLRHYEDGRKIEYGDIADLKGKGVTVRPLTLTSRNLILSYKKGLLNRRNLVIVLALECAVLVQEKKRPKHLEMRFEVSQKDGDLVFFDLWLSGLDIKTWLEKLDQVIAEPLTSDRSSALK